MTLRIEHAPTPADAARRAADAAWRATGHLDDHAQRAALTTWVAVTRAVRAELAHLPGDEQARRLLEALADVADELDDPAAPDVLPLRPPPPGCDVQTALLDGGD